MSASPSLWAADLNGKWLLPFTDAESKERENVFTFTVAGGTVTDTLVQNGKTLPVEQGRYSANVMTFVIYTSKSVSYYEGHRKEDHIEFDV